ncbi:DUF695 domain-containing protein [Pseudoduganella eburnea]|uniref:DUF695 domain-containing protein n=1 Tax=Massilia eburnea TaxID=1776165 RepID=A0A6L6QML1_9BURK|nr:DUF695 domain-containing protein [Massilia eburnea]
MLSYLTAQLKYEDMPLALRVRPYAEDDEIWQRLPHLVTLTHTLEEVLSDGMPMPDYNDTLLEFDGDVHDAVLADGEVFLVETFNGRRTYYACVSSTARAEEALQGLISRYATHDLQMGGKRNHAKKFYQRYRQDFKWPIAGDT